MKKTVKCAISWMLSAAMTVSAGIFPVMTASAKDNVILKDGFDSYGEAGSYMVGRSDGWEQVTQDSWKVVKDPDGTNNLVGENTATGWVTNRKTAPLDTPLVISGRMRMDKGSLGIGLRSTGNENMLTMNADQKIVLYNNIEKKNVETGASWVKNKWFDYILCLRSNADPAQSKTYLYLRGDGVSKAVTAVEESFDLTQYKYDGTLVKYDANGSHFYLDDVKIYNAPTLDLSISQNTNVTSSIKLDFNHPIDPSTFAKESVSVTKNGVKAAISNVLLSEDWQSAVITFGETLNGIYKVQADRSVKDVARNSASNAVYFSTDNTTPPDSELLPILVEGIRLEPEQMDMRVGFTENFEGMHTYAQDQLCVPKYTILPSTASNQKLEWISEDPSIAAIDKNSGNITPLKEGITAVYARSTDGGGVTSAKMTVSVGPKRDMQNQKLNLSKSETQRIDKNQFLSWPKEIGSAQVALWEDNRTGAFTMTVDDGISGDFDAWNELTDQYGFPFTFFVPGETLLSTGLESGVPKLSAHGQDVQSHTQTHVSSTDQGAFSSGWWLEDFGHPLRILKEKYGIQGKTLAYSYGTAGATPGIADNADYMREYYIAARGVTGNINPAEQLDYNYISSASMTGSVKLLFDQTSYASMEGMVKSLYDENYTHKGESHIGGWACTHAHGITATGWDGTGSDGKPIPADNPDLGKPVTTGEMFAYVFDHWLKPASDAGKVWVDTFTNVAMYAQSRDTSKITIGENTAEKISFHLSDQMDDTIFNYPLTVKVRVSNDWNNIGAVQNGKEIDVKTVIENANQYVMIKAVPDAGMVTITPESRKPLDPITALNVSFKGNLNQTAGQTQAVQFTAAPTPSENIDPSTIAWYVNGEKQEQSGIHFTYTPQGEGQYKVEARAANSVISNSLAIQVEKAQIVTPTPPPAFTEDTVLLEENFDDYKVESGEPAVGKYMPVETHTNVDGVSPYKWNGGNENNTLNQRRTTVIVNNPDGMPGNLSGFQFSDLGNDNLQLNREREEIRPGDTLVLSGRVMPTALKDQYLQLNLRQAKVKTILNCWFRESNGDMWVRDANGSVITRTNLNEWARYNVAVTIAEDLSQCPVTIYMTGGIDEKDRNTGALKIGTVDLNAGITAEEQKFNFTDKTTKITYFTSFSKSTAKGSDLSRGEEEKKYDGLYQDDIKIYKAGNLELSIPSSTEIENTVTVYTNHDMNIGTIDTQAFIVTDAQGEAAPVQEVIYDKSLPNQFTLKFADGALKAASQYTVSLKETANDFLGKRAVNTQTFSTKATQKEDVFGDITYTINGAAGEPGTFTAGTLTARVSVTANVSERIPATLAVAQYENDRIIGVQTSKIVVEKGNTGTVSADMRITKTQGTTVKLLLWDIENGLRPLTQAVTLKPAV